MNKRTKRNRNRNKKLNKSKKYYGGLKVTNPNVKSHPGIFDMIGNKLSSYSGNAAGYITDKGLRLIGLEKIKNDEPNANDTVTAVDDKIGKISDAATNAVSGIASQASAIGADVVKVADGTSAAILENVNDVLESPKVEHSVTEAAQQTAENAVNLLNKVNVALDTPELKAATESALNNAAAYTNIAVESMDEPLNNAIDTLNAAGVKAASGVGTGAAKLITDVALEIPGVGAVIDVLKMANDGTASVADVVEASSTAVEAVSDAVEQTSENFKEGIDKLKEAENKVAERLEEDPNVLENGSTKVLENGTNSLNKLNKEGTNTLNRVNNSIDEFHNPLKKNDSTNVSGGSSGSSSRKTRRNLFNRKAKSKRVRFAL